LGETVVVASPSIQVLGQNLAEYRALAVDGKPAVAFLLGAQEFVCAAALRAWILSASDREAAAQAQAWIDSGAGGTTAETAIFHAAAPGIGWLLDDLLHAAPEVSSEEVRLMHRDLEDPGGMSYLAMRQRARDDATVLFCTHAALVWDERLKAGGGEGMLPPYQCLLVDEAHLLASIAEQAFSTQTAFSILTASLHDEPTWRSVRALSAARHAATRLQALMAILQHDEALRLQGEGDVITPQLLDHLRPSLVALEKALKPLVERKVRTATTPTVEDTLALVRGLLKRELDATVTFSPVRRLPSITAGPRSLRWFFEALWERVARVVLVSATLYLPREMADESYGLIKTVLYLPADRIRTFSPVIPRWLYAVALHVPSAEDRGALMPPQETNFAKTADYLAAMVAWHDTLATHPMEIYASAAGGVLVLLPGYEPILELGRRLEADLGPPLIVQQRGGLRAARKRFVEAAREDLRCLWLATGPAWTGLDLNAAQVLDPGIVPARDRLLTDLVLPRVPLGTEHSSIHQARRVWMPTAERDRAAFQFRQGIGRLMRREGVGDRRLWVLDGRIWEPSQKWLFVPVRAILEAYQR
jgi:ATP-dependent DNA helicase DinG